MTVLIIFIISYYIIYSISLDFWNTDKQVVQKKSAELISSLFDYTLHVEHFMSCALEEFNNKWTNIDFLRLDKYIMLMDCLYNKFFSLKRIINKPQVSYRNVICFAYINRK